MRHWLFGLIVLIACSSQVGCGSQPQPEPEATAVNPLTLPDFPNVQATECGLSVDSENAFELWQFITVCQANTDLAGAMREAYLDTEKTVQYCRKHVNQQQAEQRQQRFWRWVERGLWSGLLLFIAL